MPLFGRSKKVHPESLACHSLPSIRPLSPIMEHDDYDNQGERIRMLEKKNKKLKKKVSTLLVEVECHKWLEARYDEQSNRNQKLIKENMDLRQQVKSLKRNIENIRKLYSYNTY